MGMAWDRFKGITTGGLVQNKKGLRQQRHGSSQGGVTREGKSAGVQLQWGHEGQRKVCTYVHV